MSKKLFLLGATGSIGTQTIECIKKLPAIELVGVACGKNYIKLKEILKNFPSIETVYMETEAYRNNIQKDFPEIDFFCGSISALKESIESCDFDIGLNAITGGQGVHSSIEVLKKGKPLLLANKESLVIAGSYIKTLAEKKETVIIPIDSEHAALEDLLDRCSKTEVLHVYLTASGGPFWKNTLEREPTIEEVLNHPTWSMGEKISVDSATMMNKGFEVIEAHHLFAIPYEKIKVVIHPASLVHALVKTRQGTVLSHMSPADMRIPILRALGFPEKYECNVDSQENEDFFCLSKKDFHFYPPDEQRFPLLGLAYDCGKRDGTATAALNAANDAIVSQFLEGKIPFSKIPHLIEKIVEKHTFIQEPSIEDLLCVVETIGEKTI